MSLWTFAGMCLAGGFGATARFLVNGLITARSRGLFDRATFVINVTGSLLLGLVIGLFAGTAAGSSGGAGWQSIIGGGFLGGYTTFSTASVETVRLLQRRRWAIAVWYAFGTLIITIAAAAIGVYAGSLISQ